MPRQLFTAFTVLVAFVLSGPAMAAPEHPVEVGETLSAIADKHGVSVEELAAANNIENADLVYAGTVLTIPGAPATVYVVEPGDTLTAVAERFGTTVAGLMADNAIGDPNIIYVGQSLSVPGSPRAGALAATAGAPPGATAADVESTIEYWAAANGVDATLIKGLAWHESGWQQDVISVAGAVGVMQLIPSASEHVAGNLIGVPGLDAAVLDDNVRMGVRYLRQLLEHFEGDERLAVAAYYQGERAVREIGVYDETELYVENVLANRDTFAGW